MFAFFGVCSFAIAMHRKKWRRKDAAERRIIIAKKKMKMTSWKI